MEITTGNFFNFKGKIEWEITHVPLTVINKVFRPEYAFCTQKTKIEIAQQGARLQRGGRGHFLSLKSIYSPNRLSTSYNFYMVELALKTDHFHIFSLFLEPLFKA